MQKRSLINLISSHLHRLKRNAKNDVSFSFIDGSGELVNLKMSSVKNELPVQNLSSLLFEFSCLDIKFVITFIIILIIIVIFLS